MFTDVKAITNDQELFYKALFDGLDHYIEMRHIKDGNVERYFFTLPELMHYPTPQDKNIYVGIYQRKNKQNGKAENCSKTNVIFLDFDNMDLTEVQFRLDHAKIPTPSMIVHSGHGYHLYWRLNKPAGHELKPILQAMAKTLNADTKATEIARVMRVPDTMNVKESPVPSKLIECNAKTHDLSTFENILGVQAYKEKNRHIGAIQELADVTFNGLHNMANGVSKGERNFCTGRITQTLKRLNYTKKEVSEILLRWNELNTPKKSTKELIDEFNTFWHDERYKYSGKDFTDERLKELNKRFIDDQTTFFKPETDNHMQFDNELLHPEKFPKISGLAFAMLSIIKLKANKGIRREHLADLCNKHIENKKFNDSIRKLKQLKYIATKRKGNATFYYYQEKPNFNRGFTSVPLLLDEVFLGGRLTENQYKLMILLESYAFDQKKEVFPSNKELMYRTKLTEKTIKKLLKELKHRSYIDIEVKKGRRYIKLIRS